MKKHIRGSIVISIAVLIVVAVSGCRDSKSGASGLVPVASSPTSTLTPSVTDPLTSSGTTTVTSFGTTTVTSSGTATVTSSVTPTVTSSGTTTVRPAVTASFSLSGARQLVALSNTIAPAAARAARSRAEGLFAAILGTNVPLQYTIVNQGLSRSEVRARARGTRGAIRSTATTSQAVGTNLLAIDAAGNASLAITSDSMVKVMYSVTDPAGEYVYIALDTGFLNPDGNDYTQFIAQNNCAFYRVKIADNSFACVQEGVYVQPMDDRYMQRVSGNQKPIQFDSEGNLYFPGTTFARRCVDGTCVMSAADWNPRIYRMKKADWSVVALTQDNQKISYFLALTTGELAYQSINSQTGDIALYLWQKSSSSMNTNGTTINLTGSTVGVDFFNVDTYNTIMWGGWAQNGIRFAKPATSGIEKATLDTINFKPKTEDKCSVTKGVSASTPYPPRRIIVSDDGKLYGVFEESTKELKDPSKASAGGGTMPGVGLDYCDSNNFNYFTMLKVYQVLPYSAVPKLELKFPKLFPDQSFSWQQWMGSTPFQVSKGYIYFKETKEKLGYGTFNTIKMVNLTNRSSITLLGGDNDWYEIYNWRLKGDRLYFAALDLSKTIVVSGEIDTAAVQQNPLRPASDYLNIRQTATAIGATSRVQDIEALSALASQNDTSAPSVQNFHVSSENIYSASVEFNKLMNKTSVENSLTFTDTDAGKAVASMKVWIGRFLHLIPDLDNNGTIAADDALLDLKSTTPLKLATNYQIDVSVSAKDESGTALGSTATKLFKTRPTTGWYDSDGVGKYAGTANKSSGWPQPELYDLNVNVYTGATDTVTAPANFRLQFKAKNHEQEGIGIILWDNTNPIPSSLSGSWLRPNVNIRLGSWSNIQYVYAASNRCWDPVTWTYTASCGVQNNYRGANTPLVFNGVWMTYRIDLYGSNMKISYSEDGSSFTTVKFDDWSTGQNVPIDTLTDLLARDEVNHAYKLFLRVIQPLDMDDLQVIKLDSSGIPDVAGTLMNVGFSAVTPPNGILDVSGTSVSAKVTPVRNLPEFAYPVNATYNSADTTHPYPSVYPSAGCPDMTKPLCTMDSGNVPTW